MNFPVRIQFTQEFWDERYRSAGKLWSGQPNPQLVAQAAGFTLGEALDAGSGEGADAIWLASRGWTVTAVDVSAVALERAAGHAGQGHRPASGPPVLTLPAGSLAILASLAIHSKGVPMSRETEPTAGAEKADVSAGDRQGFDTTVAHSARVHDYWLGGKDNFAADRAAGDAVIAAYPGIVMSVQANRAFLARVVRFLTAEAGIRQFLDIGTGIPASNNTHEVAQSMAPDCRVVYVDYDPVVLTHARALLTSSAEGVTDYIDADLREPEKILQEAARTLDFSRPVAVMLIAIMHLIGDQDDPYGIVGRLMAATPAGSYLALSQVASDIQAEQMAEAARRYNRLAHEKQRHRSHDEVAHFFDGLELLEPGLVPVQEWRPRSEIEAKTRSAMWGGVGLKQ